MQNSSSTSNQAETHLTHEDSSDIDKNLTLEELINEYNDTEITSTQHNITFQPIHLKYPMMHNQLCKLKKHTH